MVLKMNDDKIKQKIIDEGFDTNIESDWYIWIKCFKKGSKNE